MSYVDGEITTRVEVAKLNSKGRTAPAKEHEEFGPSQLLHGMSYWAGEWRSGERRTGVIDPETGRVVGYVLACDSSDVDVAVRDLRREFEQEPWPLYERRETFTRAADLLTIQRASFVEVMSSESSKTVRDCEREIDRAIETLRLCGEILHDTGGRVLDLDSTERGYGDWGWYSREPVGVVAAITPFNDPLNLVVHKLGPALAAGNVVILKPSDKTPLTALALLNLLLMAGLPPRRVAVLTGSGRTIGAVIVQRPEVSFVSFTGSPVTGDTIARDAGAKKTAMELGGSGAAIVLGDADINDAAKKIAIGAFNCAGQNCISVQRVYVMRPAYEGFLANLIDHTRQLAVGSKYDRATTIGPMIDADAAIRVERIVEDSVRKGAQVHLGGTRRGPFYLPTILTDVPEHHAVLAEEVFGPVVSVQAIDTIEDAIRLTNDSPYGLQSGIFTSNIDSAMTIATRLRVGGVIINETGDFRVDAMPFGGFNRSGHGREGVRSTFEAMSEPKIIVMKRR